ncbi:AlpA family transcriptional regulator [Kineobactrum sediminis]|uniref:AlpA family transcriptional regulator n=1 Tax=Kineobactrum sediminis TaxID=1905677 RepID=A0A2N5Y4K7_9GAMM|nr:AlpA family phage regulatory protein [Kineobactrum sediminis]PLW83311.1 AlpA family transcriptional regulator [Kineobactrum sediminis]
MHSAVYLSDTAIAQRFQVSRATVWRWTRSVAFPKPIKLSVGCTRWRLADIEAWEQTRNTPGRRR